MHILGIGDYEKSKASNGVVKMLGSAKNKANYATRGRTSSNTNNDNKES
jgi:hypothetical protein